MIVSCSIICIFKDRNMIVLASASPRRKDILTELGVPFSVICADTDESSVQTDPRLFTEELAARKGMAVYKKILDTHGKDAADEAIIISADTVVCCNGTILGKPRDNDDAERMIAAISGKDHTVVSGVAITINGKAKTASDVTVVRVDDIPPAKIKEYVNTGESLDKAGAYAIQGRFSVWIRSIDGCYFNVVGLPINCLNKLFFDCTGNYLI